MKITNIFSISLVLLCGLSVVCQAEKAGNALRNGSFELVNSKGKISNWRLENWGNKGKRLTMTADKNSKADGKQSTKIETDSTSPSLVLYQDVKIDGKNYGSLSLMAKGDKNIYAELVFFNGNEIVARKSTETIKGEKTWTPLKVSISIPETSNRVRVILRATGNVWFDNIVLKLENRVQAEPSNASELKNKKIETVTNTKINDIRKTGMSPQEQKWENILKANLGPYYFPQYKAAKEKGQVTAWDFVRDNPSLPRVLIIGDSISRGYTVPVRKMLKGKVNLHRAPANCGPTGLGLKKLDVWLGNGSWDLIFFNFGIHDRNTDLVCYVANLEKIIARLNKTGAKIVWASSTPLNGGEKFPPGSMLKLNKAAAELMKKKNIPICDLYSVAKEIQGKCQGKDGCHYNAKGYDYIATYVAKNIIKNIIKK